MFNAGVRGKRAKDSTGLITVGEHFNQQNFLVPTVTRFAITDGSYVDTDDTAADPAGNQVIVLYGSGFAPGATVLVGSTTIGAVTFLDSGRLTFSSPALGSGSYTVFVTNANGGTGILVPGLVYSGVPTFTTAAGSLGSVYETTAINTTVVATGDEPITYALSSGSLPSGSTLSSGGTISGTAPVDGSSTTYSFTVRATDADNQDSVRSFSLTINTDVVSFSSPANNTTTTATQNSAISNVTVTATSAAGYGVLYTSSGLPTGLSMNTSTGIISGTPTVVASNTSIITATANTTSRTAALYLNWTINLPGDLFWKYASLLMSASTVPNGNTFNTDASTINNEIIVVADTKPNEFHPFKEGYYSNFFDGTGDFLSLPTSTAFALSGDYTIEAWVYKTDSGTQRAIVDLRGGGNLSILFYTLTGGQLAAFNSTSTFIQSTGTIPLNQWTHVAITRSGTSVRLFINGVIDGTATNSDVNVSAGTGPYIGRQNGSTSSDWLGYISNVRILKDTALYTTAFTPPTGPLTYVANTTLLTCQSNKLIDNSNNNTTITKNGDVRINPFSPFNGTPTTITVPGTNNYSMYFDGTGDYLSFSSNSAFGFGTGDFTVEYWVYSISWATAPTVVDLRTPSGSSLQWSDNFSAGGAPGMYYNATQVLTSSITIPLRTWAHVAYTREGSTVKVWVNGVQGATGTSSFNLQATGGFSIGTNNGNANPFNGYVSNIRILKGTALYTTTFTPPAGPLTVIANTSLLTAQANTVIDNSNNQITFTVNGNAGPARNGPFANTTTVTLVGNEGSAYFDGTGDYLEIPHAPSQWIGLNTNFTIECWFNLTGALGSERVLIAKGYQGSPNYAEFGIVINGSNQLLGLVSSSGGSWLATPTDTVAITPNTWFHAALVRNGTTITLYKNGAAVATSTSVGAALYQHTGTIRIGQHASGSNFLGYISNARVVIGTALYTTPFVPTFAPLTPVANTVLLTAQTNLSSNTKVIVDESNFAGVVSGFGNTNLGTFSPSGSSWSVVFDGTNDYIAMPTSSSFNFGTGDFTVECWVYWNSTAIDRGIISRYAGASSGWALRYDVLGLNWINGDTSIVAAAHTPVGGTWYHYAACRSGSTLRLFINGTQSASVTYSGNQDNSSSLYIGQLTNTLWPVNGYISNVRILKGTALYTSAFTPSTTPLLPVANTVLLTCNSNQYVDYSAANNFITRTGDAAVAKFSPFSSVTVTPASYSGYFNSLSSTTTYPSINVSTSSTFNLYPVDSTVECWFILNAYGNGSNPTAVSTLFSFYSGSAATYYGVKVTNNGFLMITKDGSGAASVTSTTFIGLNTWYHFAWVHTAGGTTNKFYLNGVDVTSTFSDPSLAGAFPLNPATSTLYIGGTYYNNNPYTYIDPWNGCISNFRIVRGTKVYTGNFTVSTTPLGLSQSASANTVALGIPANGNSVFFDGTGDYLTTATTSVWANLWFGDVTVECWVYFNSVASTPHIWSFSESSTARVTLYVSSSVFKLYTQVSTGGDIITSATTLTTGRWYHVAITKNSGTWTMWLDGISQGTSTSTRRPYNVNEMLAVGTQNYSPGAGDYLNGYISNLHAVSNTALYTTSFTPPTGPLTAIANTVLLTCQNSTTPNTRIIIDNSTNSFPISSVGDTVISRIVSPFGNTAALLTCQSTSFVDTSNSAFAITVNNDAKPVIQNPFTNTVSAASNYSANTFGNSIYFDGTTDYLSMSAVGNPLDWPASANYTIEAWVYLNAFTGSESSNILARRNPTATTTDWQFQISTAGALVLYNLNGSTTITATSNMAIKQWNHCAAVISGGTATLYLNGVKVSTATAISAASTASISTYIVGASNSVYLNGYISNLRVVKGQALYTGPFIPSNQPLPVTSNTVLLLASTVGPSTADATRNHNIETFGTARRVANNSPYYDTYSAYFDGTGDYLTFGANQANLGLGTGDFTFEFWFNALTIPAGEIDIFESQTNNSFRILKRASSSGLSFDPYGGTATLIMADASITTNTWHHVAVSRTSGTTSAYYDGTRVVNQADSTNYAAPVANYGVGGRASGANYLTGYISNMRLIKGTGLYSGTTITVPTSPLTAVANTQLLICNNNRFIDGSTNAFTITKAGDAKITAFEPFDSSNNSRFNSIYFGTKTDYLAIRQQANLKIFPGDFTFECWVYPTDTTLSTAWTIWDARQTGASAAAMTFGLGALASPVTGSWRMAYFNGTNYYGTGTILWNQWTHVAWVRSGTTMTFYVNGVASGTATVSGTQTATATTNPIYIGTKDNGLAGYGTVGYIADFRITNGYARTITVPTAPYDIK